MSTTTAIINPVDAIKTDDLPPVQADRKVYEDYLVNLNPTAGIWDRGKGWISWIQGTVLNRLKDSKKCTASDYAAVLEMVGISRSTGYHCCRIAAKIKEEDAMKMGYTEMAASLGCKSLKRKKGGKTVTPENLVPVLTDMAQTISNVTKLKDRRSKKGLKESKDDYKIAKTKLTAIIRDATKAKKMIEDRLKERKAA